MAKSVSSMLTSLDGYNRGREDPHVDAPRIGAISHGSNALGELVDLARRLTIAV